MRDAASPLPPGVGFLARGAVRTGLWVARRPFLAHPLTWAGLAVVATGAAEAGYRHGAPLPLVGAAAGIAALAVALAAGWQLLRARRDRPVVFISLFATDAATELATAHAHLRALERHLERSVGTRFAVRVLRVPLSRRMAGRLLAVASPHLVVYGRVSAVADLARWECQLAMPAGGDFLQMSADPLAKTTREQRVRISLRAWRAMRRAEPEGLTEASYPVRQLVAEHTEARHFDGIIGALELLMVESAHLRGETPSEALPRIDRDTMSPDLIGRVLACQAFERLLSGEAPLETISWMAGELEKLEAPSAMGWRFVNGATMLGFHEGWCDADRQVALAERRAQVFPVDATVWWDLAGSRTIAGQFRSADEALDRARELGMDRRLVLQQRGANAWSEGRVDEALGNYRRVARWRRSNSGHLVRMADCLAVKGRPRRALRLYRLAIRRDVFNRNAIAGARGSDALLGRRQMGGLRLWSLMHARGHGAGAKRAIAGAWLACLLRYRGEHPSAHAWCGRRALLRFDLAGAEEWLYFAWSLPGALRLQPALDLALVCELLGRRERAAALWHHAASELGELRRVTGVGVPRPDLEGLLIGPALLQPRIREHEGYSGAVDAVRATFGIVLPGPIAGASGEQPG